MLLVSVKLDNTVSIVFFLWQNEDMKPNLEQVQRRDYTTFSVGSHHEATRVVDRL